MKALLVFCFFTMVFSCPTQASGLGWGVQSLDWKKYESDKVQIDTAVKKCIDLGGEEWRWCGERKIVSMFIGTREQRPDSLEKYSVKNVIPQGLEYITIDVVHEAYDIQTKHNPSTLFGLFKSGRSEWKGQWVGCSAYPDMAWDCLTLTY